MPTAHYHLFFELGFSGTSNSGGARLDLVHSALNCRCPEASLRARYTFKRATLREKNALMFEFAHMADPADYRSIVSQFNANLHELACLCL